MDELIKLLLEYWPFWVGAIVFFAIILLLRMFGGEQKFPYNTRNSLVTRSELKFYRALVKAAQDDFAIFAMVRLADLFTVAPQTKNYRSWLNKILAKHVDFVLCDPLTLQPLVCIELDDASHQKPDRIERDILVNKIFDSADLPLLRIPVQPSYHARELRELIDGVR